MRPGGDAAARNLGHYAPVLFVKLYAPVSALLALLMLALARGLTF